MTDHGLRGGRQPGSAAFGHGTNRQRPTFAISLKFALVLVVLIVLQYLPASGSILQGYGVEAAIGWLGQLVLVSFLIDGLKGNLPRIVIMLPIGFYLTYYIALWMQGAQIENISREFQRTNPGQIMEFDPKSHSLIIDKANDFVLTHAIPVAYSKDSSFLKNAYVSYRWVRKDTAADYALKSAGDVQATETPAFPDMALLRIPGRPTGLIVSASVRDSGGNSWANWKIGVETTTLHLSGRQLGAFKSGYVQRLSLVPFLTVGCSAPGGFEQRQCALQLKTERVVIGSGRGAVSVDPLGIMLGIKAPSHSDLSRFGDDAVALATPEEDEAFAALQEILKGGSPLVTWKTSALLSNNPTRLAPLTAAMAKRFTDLMRADLSEVPARMQYIQIVAAGLEALAPEEFAAAEDGLTELTRASNAIRDMHPVLYIRLASSGPKMFSIYRDQFLADNATERNKLLAALGICRMGQADTRLLDAIRLEWTKYSTGEANNVTYQSALFVTLLKLASVRGLPRLRRQVSEAVMTGRPGSQALRSWYDAVLAGTWGSVAGPNNCMPVEWPEAEPVPPALAPTLQWRNKRWSAGEEAYAK